MVHGGTWWYMVVHGGTWWYMVVHGGTWWHMVVHGIFRHYQDLYSIIQLSALIIRLYPKYPDISRLCRYVWDLLGGPTAGGGRT